MTQTPHTSTPWKAELARTLVHITNGHRGVTAISIAPPKGSTAAERKEYRERALADAAFIVKAANCHDDLRDALMELVGSRQREGFHCHKGITTVEKCAECGRHLRAWAALDKAAGT